MPKAIIMDRDTALMNAVAKVFASFNALLCRYHIACNMRSKVKPVVGVKQVETEGGKPVKPEVVVDQIMDAWACIASSSTKELYADAVLQFRKVCEKYPDLLKYVESTILDKVKEKFVCAWTNNVRHLGNTTTNRVESAHVTLKNWLGNSKGDLCQDWDTINLMIKNQHNEIQTSFGQRIIVLEHRFKDNILYSQLIGNMSQARLNYIFHEAKRGEIFGGDSAKCGCTITMTYGLLCACVITKKVRLGELIRMDKVTPHWKRLSFDDDGYIEGEKSNISITSELETIHESFSKADDNMKLYIKEH
ncbi:uncharacterized protein LOC131625001 [Vicia villosa]|uniref:uncharacterized protein LOC131625001 n=1 Tax=Vicia villosa TaxID=3911 RepID=UPI00273B9104|nr:uncharacterized protein LOC131625001 [Vicia villosa]